jgi:hypothetical protein
MSKINFPTLYSLLIWAFVYHISIVTVKLNIGVCQPHKFIQQWMT